MTPKEKAVELYEKFFYIIPSMSDEGQIEDAISKQCALIAVEMVILNCYEEEEYYWQEVKQEIEKL